jgi:tRNA (guanine-N7-)-methyltransferase
MGRKNKLRKFKELLAFPNVVENYDIKNPALILNEGEIIDLKGRWKKDFFKNDKPLILELACGRGEYTVQLARKYPDRNFLGIDIKGARIWQGAKLALEEELNNVGFLRTRIEQIGLFIGPGEVDEIWITFPDPFLKKENRRLTSNAFLDRYKKILAQNNTIHLKTDDPTLYEFSMEVLRDRKDVHINYFKDDIYSEELVIPELEFKTYYEAQHLSKGRKIKYISFQLKID